MRERKINIVLVDDHVLFREGVLRLLNSEPDFEVVGHGATVAEALSLVAGSDVDVLLLDLDLGEERGSEVAVKCREQGYRGRILLVTAGVSPTEGAHLLQLGVDGIFLKHSPPQELATSIRAVVAGEKWIDDKYAAGASGPAQNGDPSRRPLTPRESAVLRGVLEGLANKEIASHLHVSESSVKATLQQLFRKTGVRTRAQLVKMALERYLDQI